MTSTAGGAQMVRYDVIRPSPLGLDLTSLDLDDLVRLGHLVCHVTVPEHEVPEWDPWVIDGIQTRGWFVKSSRPRENGLNAHGAVDWAPVAHVLADLLSTVASEVTDSGLTDRINGALNQYAVAQMEVSLAEGSSTEDDDGEG